MTRQKTARCSLFVNMEPRGLVIASVRSDNATGGCLAGLSVVCVGGPEAKGGASSFVYLCG